MHLKLAARLGLMVGPLLVLAGPANAQVVLQTQDLRLEIGADGLLRSLTAKSSGIEYAWAAAPMPIASVYRGGQMAVGSQEDYGEFEVPVYRGGRCFPASAVSLAGDTLTIRFGFSKTRSSRRVRITHRFAA